MPDAINKFRKDHLADAGRRDEDLVIDADRHHIKISDRVAAKNDPKQIFTYLLFPRDGQNPSNDRRFRFLICHLFHDRVQLGDHFAHTLKSA